VVDEILSVKESYVVERIILWTKASVVKEILSKKESSVVEGILSEKESYVVEGFILLIEASVVKEILSKDESSAVKEGIILGGWNPVKEGIFHNELCKSKASRFPT
jgi:hypothetical protein